MRARAYPDEGDWWLVDLLAAGVPPHVVRDIFGHYDLRVTSPYARPHDDALDQVAETLNGQ